MLRYSWEMLFFKSGGTGVFKADRNKPFASNKRQIDNHTLMLHMLHSYMSVGCTYHCRGVIVKVFFYTRQPPGWKSRRAWNDVYLAFVLTAIIYSSGTLPDYMMSLTLYTPISESIFSILFSIYFLMCWEGEFVQQSRGSSVDYHFLYSHDLNVWLRGDIEGRN